MPGQCLATTPAPHPDEPAARTELPCIIRHPRVRPRSPDGNMRNGTPVRPQALPAAGSYGPFREGLPIFQCVPDPHNDHIILVQTVADHVAARPKGNR